MKQPNIVIQLLSTNDQLFSRWAVVSGLMIMTAAWSWLAWASQDYASVNLVSFYGGLFPAVAVWLVFVFTPEKKLLPLGHYFITTAVAIRVIALFAYPILEDDHYRYLWDGFLVVNYGNPYGYLPADFFGSDDITPTAEAWLDGVSYPNLATVYGPVCELIFGLSYWLHPDSLIPLKGLVLLADLALLWLLKRIAPPKGWYLYALCPLLIHSFNFNLHSDIFAVAFLFAAFYFGKSQLLQQALLTVLCAAMAFLAKPFALIALPFLFRFQFIKWFSWLALVLAVEIPLHLTGGTQWSSVATMGSNWQFNSGIWLLFAHLFSPQTASAFWLASLIGVFTWVFYRQHIVYQPSKQLLERFDYQPNSNLFRGDIIYGVFLLLGAVVNPWYFIWVLAFSAVFPRYWCWVASCALMLSYCSGINLGSTELDLYDIPLTIVVLEYSIILLAIVLDSYSGRLGNRA